MHMTRRIGRAAVALLAVIALAFGITSVSTATPDRKVKAPGIYHPCDLNRNTRAGTGRSTEALCVRVWRHDTYTVSSGGTGGRGRPGLSGEAGGARERTVPAGRPPERDRDVREA